MSRLKYWSAAYASVEGQPQREFCHRSNCYWGTALRKEQKQHAFQTDFCIYTGAIISKFISQELLIDGDLSAYPFDFWPDLTFKGWNYEVNEENRVHGSGSARHSDLKYLMFGDLQEPEYMEVIEDIWFHNPRLRAVCDVTDIASFDESDDNFYALLGTKYGTAAALLLEHYQDSFATKARRNGTVEKVKTIRDVKVAGVGPPGHEPGPGQTVDSFYKFAFQMFIMLDDVDPPPSTGDAPSAAQEETSAQAGPAAHAGTAGQGEGNVAEGRPAAEEATAQGRGTAAQEN